MQQTLCDLSVAILLGLWLVLSVAFNLPRCKRSLSRIDFLSLLPAWSFFAPTPGTRDYHWLFRDRLSDGTLTPWTELTTVAYRPILTSLINPNKRATKTLLDIAGELSSPASTEGGFEATMLSLSYLLLLHSLSLVQHTTRSRQTQFMIMASSGTVVDLPPSVIFVSAFHNL
jgi:hypothetical protein